MTEPLPQVDNNEKDKNTNPPCTKDTTDNYKDKHVKGEERLIPWGTLVTGIGTLLLAIATIKLVYKTGDVADYTKNLADLTSDLVSSDKEQTKIMDLQRVLMERQDSILKDQGVIMRGQSKLMAEQTDISREASHVANRAYVVFDALGFDTATGRKLEVIDTFINLGNTPAYNVSASKAMDTTDSFSDSNLDRSVLDTGFTIGSKMKYPFGMTCKFADPREDSIIINGKAPLYYYVSITYNDVFGETHHTRICLYIDFGRGVFVQTGRHYHSD